MSQFDKIVNSKRSIQDLDDLCKEPWLLSMLGKLNDNVFSVDETLFTEVRGMVSSANDLRPRITVVRNPSDLIDLQQDISQVLALRSRLIEIYFCFIDVQKELETMWELAEAKLLTYPIIQEKLSSDAKRNLFIRDILAEVFKKRQQVEKLVDMCDRVKSHLDDVHYTQKTISDLAITYIKSRGP